MVSDPFRELFTAPRAEIQRNRDDTTALNLEDAVKLMAEDGVLGLRFNATKELKWQMERDFPAGVDRHHESDTREDDRPGSSPVRD
jgi:hypothetical protein